MNKRPAIFQEGLRNEKRVDVLGFGVYNGVTRVIVEQAEGKVWLAELQHVRFTDKLKPGLRPCASKA